jgi:hypothetical protein
MWVEKNGQGSSQGPACDSPQSDLQFAARRSVAGLKRAGRLRLRRQRFANLN